VDHRQKNWLKWLVLVEFAVNSKVYSATKVFLFINQEKRKSREDDRICGKNEKI